MCGIAGLWTIKTQSTDIAASVQKMSNSLMARGPDSGGIWCDEHAGLALGHRRLAIVDLSAAGHQPMMSAHNRFVLTFNGEIYNHLELRNQLAAAGAAPAWRGGSDTETILACFEYWGIAETLRKTTGMFALALWDRQQETLYLARDRFGEKPLYYGWTMQAFVFGSELKALKATPGFANELSQAALADFLRFTYVPAPRSIYRNVFKLEPGCLLTIAGRCPDQPPDRALRPGDAYHSLRIERWWNLAGFIETHPPRENLSGEELTLELDGVLSRAVSQQMMADVPLGAFLSGGVDSSTVVALMQKASVQKVKTFTIGYRDSPLDESVHAERVARHLGTEHQTFYVSPTDALDVIPHLADIYDEPFSDSSQIPTYLVCKAARQHVTVALSGDAGDESFGGYNRYLWGQQAWSKIDWLPYGTRKLIGHALDLMPPTAWNALGRHRVGQPADKAAKFAQRLKTVRNDDDFYFSLVTEWNDPHSLLQNPDLEDCQPFLTTDRLPATGLADPRARMMYRDTMSYLPDDILCKVDRAAMAVSLETRVPFLNHHVVEYAWQLPMRTKINGAQGKWPLRQVLYRYVPRELIERPKAGFAVPVGEWMRGPLRPWAEELLDERRLRREGIFRPELIRGAWHRHLSGLSDLTPKLWAVLMFQAWHEKNRS